MSGRDVLDTLVINNIITLPSINLDFLQTDRVEFTQSLLNQIGLQSPNVLSQLKQKLDVRENVKNYISNKLPDPNETYFPIQIEGINELQTLYVISQFL